MNAESPSGAVKPLLRHVVSERMRLRLRRLGRLRWITKAGLVRASGQSPLAWWRFVLFDPEVDSFTYAIDNGPQLAAALAEVLGRPAALVERCLDEATSDPLLTRALRQPRRRLWAKRQPPLHGFLLTHWAATRLTKPVCVAEAGVLDGLGSTVILVALARNAEEGQPGELLSIDTLPNAGALVPEWLRANWTLRCGDSGADLDSLLTGRRVGYFVSDSLPNEAHVRAELSAVLKHRADSLFAAAVWADITAFDEPGEVVLRFQDQPRAHFYGGRRFTIARL